MRAIIFLMLTYTSSAFADSLVSCDYKIMVADFATIAVMIYDDGQPASSVTITHYGNKHKEPATAAPKAEGEFAHLWVSKGTKNELEMIVYKPARPEGDSKLINPSTPYGNTMWAKCTGIP